MKLRILAVAAGFVVIPAIAHAQGTDTLAVRTSTSDGTSCPQGCAAMNIGYSAGDVGASPPG